MTETLHTDQITGQIIETSIAIHRDLGPGLMESVYESILAHELRMSGLRIRRQLPIRLEYHGITFNEAFRADIVVEGLVIVEIKAVARLEPVFARQILTYLRLMSLPVGLLINFGEHTLLKGVRRIVNKMPHIQGSRVRVNDSNSTQKEAEKD